MNISNINSMKKLEEWCCTCFENDCELSDYCEKELANIRQTTSNIFALNHKNQLKLQKIILLIRKEKLEKLLS